MPVIFQQNKTTIYELVKLRKAPARHVLIEVIDLEHDGVPTHGYAATREAAMAPFGKSWRRE